jgi:hypothetical protein
VLVLAALGMSGPGATVAPAGVGNLQVGSGDAKLVPAGSDMIHVVSPAEFTVPVGKVFVLTAVNTYMTHSLSTGFPIPVRIQFNDVAVFAAIPEPQNNFVEFPTGLAAQAGDTVRMEFSTFPGNPPPGGTLLGYLEDA